jgi:hypothetical protein
MLFIPETTPVYIAEAASKARAVSAMWVLAFLTEENADKAQETREALEKIGLPVYGGVFPGLIFGGKAVQHGCLLHFMHTRPPVLVNGTSDEIHVPDGISGAILLVDGRSSEIETLLDLVQARIPNVPVIGGGAGYASLQPHVSIFDPQGWYCDAALLIPYFGALRFTVQHGWQPCIGPVIVTKSTANAIHELNWRPAFELYQELINESENVLIRKEHFYDQAKAFPFGMIREGREHIIRDPLGVGTNGTDLICVGEVPQNTAVYIMKGTVASLVDAAEKGIQPLTEAKAHRRFIFDCISRYLFLGNRFENELKAIAKGQVTVLPTGALTLGEIASDPNGAINFLNKTLVVANLYEAV